MGLILNGIYGMRVLANTLGGYRKPPVTSANLNRNFRGNKVSLPVGYNNKALILPLSSGGIACYIKGVSSLSAAIDGVGVISSALAGNSALSANGALGRNLGCTMQGTGAVTASIDAKGWLTCTIQIGAQPSAFDIAQAVLNAVASQYNIAGTIGAAIQSGGGGAGGGGLTAEEHTKLMSLPETAGLTTEQSNKLMKSLTKSEFIALK